MPPRASARRSTRTSGLSDATNHSSAPSSRRAPVKAVVDSDDEDEDGATVADTPPAASRSRRAPVGRKKIVESSDEDEASSEEEAVPPPKKRAASTKQTTTARRAPAASKKPPPPPVESPSSSDAEEEDEEQVVVKPEPVEEDLPVEDDAEDNNVEPPASAQTGDDEVPAAAQAEAVEVETPAAAAVEAQPEPEPVATQSAALAASYDLAATARRAALEHAAQEKQREKEKEGQARLVIHQLVLKDFKSYRGREVIGPFHKSFSSIVGPNGSGKSNTIDALLFVFGYRATKMRQGKLSELIHNSGVVAPKEAGAAATEEPAPEEDGERESDEDSDSDDGWTAKGKGKKGKGKGAKGGKKKPEEDTSHLPQSCTVEVHFREIIDLPLEGKDAFSVVPNSSLVVARTADRSNASRYTLNGRTSNYKEVTTLLKDRGIDLDHKRFLILQGEVESIAQMKPKGSTPSEEGLLEYLEDIIGTSKYKDLIEEQGKQVEELGERRTEKMGRLKLVEREKVALEGRKKEADTYLREQNELVHNKSALCQVNIHKAATNAAALREMVEAAEEEMKEEVEAQSERLKETEELQDAWKALSEETKAVEKEVAGIVKELAVLDRADVQLQEKKKAASTKLKKIKKSVADDSHALNEAGTTIKNTTDNIQRERASLERLEASLEKEEIELDKVRDGLKGKTEAFSEQIEVLQTELQPWLAQIADKKAAIDLSANERDMLVEKAASAGRQVEDAAQEQEALVEGLKTKKHDLGQMQKEFKTVRAETDKLEEQITQHREEEGKLRAKAAAARSKADEATATQSASKAKGAVLASLMKLKDQGRLNGFHGRLGDLGRIDDKYDIAISTAVPDLDNLVAETLVTGQACLEHLRKNNVGRAKVVCLDRMAGRDLSKIATPENVPRLFDLITFKEDKFAPAFFQAMANTLVANDLAQANRIAFGGAKRWRVVTLDGKLIDASGTMSGGGNRVAKGGMSSRIAGDELSPEQVAKLEREREAASGALRECMAQRTAAEEELADLKKHGPELELAIEKAQMDLESGARRVEDMKTRLAELQAQSKPDAGDTKRIAAIEKELEALNKERAPLQKKAKVIEDQINALQEKILEVGGVRLRTQQTKVTDLKAQIDHSSDMLTKAEVGKAKAEKDQVKFTKAIEANKGSLECLEEEIEKLSLQIAKGSEDSNAVRQAVEQAQSILEEKRDELKEMKDALDEKLAERNQFKARELELQQTVTASKKRLDESNQAVAYWTKELGKLKLNDLDEEDEETPEGEEEQAPGLNSELREFTPEEIQELDPKALQATILAIEDRISRMNLDLTVLKEYARREKEFMSRATDLEAVTKERDAAKNRYDELRNQRLQEFMAGFGIISMKLKEMYQMITLGGNAELELVDSLDPFSEGIIFSVMPPKKSWKNISNLSGGEKTLSSLALVFALHVFKPTPLYFMDEIDAALDFRNVSIVANYIKDRTKNAQFIIISLRNNMFELASRLVGVYKVNNGTRSISIDNNDLPSDEQDGTSQEA